MAYLGPQPGILGTLRGLKRDLKKQGIGRSGRAPLRQAIQDLRGGQNFNQGDWRQLRGELGDAGVPRGLTRGIGQTLRGQLRAPIPYAKPGSDRYVSPGGVPEALGLESVGVGGGGPEGSPGGRVEANEGPYGLGGGQPEDMLQQYQQMYQQMQQQQQGIGQPQMASSGWNPYGGFDPRMAFNNRFGSGQYANALPQFANNMLRQRRQAMPFWEMPGGYQGGQNWGQNSFLNPLQGLQQWAQGQGQEPPSRVTANNEPVGQQPRSVDGTLYRPGHPFYDMSIGEIRRTTR